ncbi:Putative uncharacterized protein [Moritella viscosa]|nr:Putative uncharacterized protein [Moritella viscosa]
MAKIVPERPIEHKGDNAHNLWVNLFSPIEMSLLVFNKDM